MNELIEVGAGSSTRKATGSKFSLNLTPYEISGYNSLYENPDHGLEIKFIAIYTRETFTLRSTKYGHVIDVPVVTGIILEKGELATAIERHKPPLSPQTAAALLRDIYELMSELFIGTVAASFDISEVTIVPHVYETERSKLRHALRTLPTNVRTGPELITNLQAQLVF